MNAIVETVTAWIAQDPEASHQATLQGLLDAQDFRTLSAQFAGRLSFGTAGLRGELGAGPLRMNRLVVRQTSAGLAAWVKSLPDGAARGVVVGHDGRIGSEVFADDTTAVLAAAGVRVWRLYGVTATPVVARAVTVTGAAAGVMVTASHNPPQYNGYKVYADNGAQIIEPDDATIAAEILQAAPGPISLMNLEDAARSGLVIPLGAPFEERYLAEVIAQQAPPPGLPRESLRIAFTAMHGVGAHLVQPLLARVGFTNVAVEESQNEPDGTFPTVNFPNPEEPGALDRVLALADRTDAHLVLANDPDADRLAVAARRADGAWGVFNGDQIGALLGDACLRTAPAGAAVATTIVSSRMLQRIAASYGATYFQTLTGFKWIANGAIARRASHNTPFVFGYEEAIGYTIGELVRDKDGVSAALAVAELTMALHLQGKTLWTALDDLYAQHGVFASAQRSLALTAGAEPLGARLRRQPPSEIAGHAIQTFADLSSDRIQHADGRIEAWGLPASDVLIWWLDDDSRIIVRPSGTEPKVKCYYEVIEQVGDGNVVAARTRADQRLQTLVAAHQAALKG